MPLLKRFSILMAPNSIIFFESITSVAFNGYPSIWYLSFHNDQNQLVLGCTKSSDPISTHFKSYTHKSFKEMMGLAAISFEKRFSSLATTVSQIHINSSFSSLKDQQSVDPNNQLSRVDATNTGCQVKSRPTSFKYNFFCDCTIFKKIILKYPLELYLH
jgi:hypothetical protein